MTQEIRRDFLNFQPDIEDFGNEGLVKADNVTHEPEGYKEVRQLATASVVQAIGFTTTAIDVRPLGANSAYLGLAYWPDTTSFNIGTLNVWSEYADTATAGATLGAIQSFSAIELEDTIVATGKYYFATASPTQTGVASGYISYSSGVGYGASSTWTTLPNSAVGIVCGVINQFAFVGNEGTVNPSRSATVRWSALGDATDWPTPNTDDARAKQAGEQTLNPNFGAVNAIAGNDFFGYILQKTAITKCTYVGGDVVFTFDTFEEARGCAFPERMVQVDDIVFFESEYHRHMMIDGQIRDIGYGKVDDTYPPVSTFYALKKNPAINTVFFSNNLAYNYKTDQWTRLPSTTPVASIESDTGIIGQLSVNRIYDSTGGTPLAATLETGSVDLNRGGRSVLLGVRPLVNGGTWTVRAGTQDDLDDAVTYTTATSVTARTGVADFRNEGRYHRVELTSSGTFETAQGADVEFTPQGNV